MNASPGVLPASAREPPVVGMPAVFTLSLTMMGMPSSRRYRRGGAPVRGAGVVERRRAHGDYGVELGLSVLIRCR